jgi:gas vesicle protein
MADSYDRYENEGGGGFMMGLLTGTVLGAGLGMLLAPKAGTELRGQLGEQARNLSSKATDGYRRASEAASGWAERGRDMVNQAKDSVGRSTDEGFAGATTGSSYSSGTSGSSFGGGTGGSSFGSGSTGSTGSTGGTGSTSGGSDFGRS